MKAKKSKAKAPKFQNRIILFLDFLGFKELVDRSTREPAFFDRLIGAMNLVGEIGSDTLLKSQKVTQFSDSIVVSYKMSEPSAVFWLLNDIALTVLILAHRGFLVRGGVTVGKLYHSKRHVVGPAMNEAYRLESKVAKYPRVVIDPKLLQVAASARSEFHSAHDEVGYVRDFMTKDADGQQFFDYISWRSVIEITGGDNDLYGSYLGTLSNLIRDGLRHDDPSVQEKFIWLRNRYKDAIKQVRALPSDHPYRRENPALCEEIGNLPTFKADTSLAKRAIRKATEAKTAVIKPRTPNKARKKP